MAAVAQDTPLLLQISLTVCCRNRLLIIKALSANAITILGFSSVHNRWVDDRDNMTIL